MRGRLGHDGWAGVRGAGWGMRGGLGHEWRAGA